MEVGTCIAGKWGYMQEEVIREVTEDYVHLEDLALKSAAQFFGEELIKMQAVLYALASKFLDVCELEEVKEAVAMTLLGQMLVEDGIKKGIREGIKEGYEKGQEDGIRALVLDNIEEGRTEEKIVEKL